MLLMAGWYFIIYVGIIAVNFKMLIVVLEVFMKPLKFLKVVVSIYISHMCICIPYDPVIPLLSMCVTEVHPDDCQKACSRMFIAALFKIKSFCVAIQVSKKNRKIVDCWMKL